MKIIDDNIHYVPKKERSLIKALLVDLSEINSFGNKQLYIDWQDYHNEYSPERVDPCPDYYGCYTLRDKNNNMIGIEMDIDTLDTVLCTLFNYIVDE